YQLLFQSEYDWNHTEAKQPVGLAFKDGRIQENRGKVLGGSSSVNGMVYNRGNRQTFDDWAHEFGAEGWTYREVLPYFKKFENNTDPQIVGDGTYHGTNGSVQITSWPQPVDPIVRIYQKAMNELGYNTTDINGAVQTGTAVLQAFIDSRGRRSSIANCYLDPNPFPQNLDILTGAHVIKILFNGQKAIGVVFVRNGLKYTVKTRREVIVSAGSIGSPQLLMLSGVGPRQELEKWGIPVVADLPVGENLQNHPALDLNFAIKEQFHDLVDSGDSELTIDNLYEYYTNGSGVLTKYYNCMTYRSTKSNNNTDFPNVSLQLALLKYPKDPSRVTVVQFEAQDEWKAYNRHLLGKPYFFVQPTLERIRSRGFVRLESTDPFVYPVINSRFLSDPQDFEDMVDITLWAFYVFEHPSIAPYVRPHKPIPGCKFCAEQPFAHKCDAYIRCLIRQVTYTGCHLVGSCRMGAAHRRDTVLDPRLRVKGVDGLRVCDASVMPTVTNGNTNAPVIMIGEKCADLVKEDNSVSA
ncbi:unnamed protein product, partial [Oppiella nova]